MPLLDVLRLEYRPKPKPKQKQESDTQKTAAVSNVSQKERLNRTAKVRTMFKRATCMCSFKNGSTFHFDAQDSQVNTPF